MAWSEFHLEQTCLYFQTFKSCQNCFVKGCCCWLFSVWLGKLHVLCCLSERNKFLRTWTSFYHPPPSARLACFCIFYLAAQMCRLCNLCFWCRKKICHNPVCRFRTTRTVYRCVRSENLQMLLPLSLNVIFQYRTALNVLRVWCLGSVKITDIFESFSAHLSRCSPSVVAHKSLICWLQCEKCFQQTLRHSIKKRQREKKKRNARLVKKKQTPKVYRVLILLFCGFSDPGNNHTAHYSHSSQLQRHATAALLWQ